MTNMISHLAAPTVCVIDDEAAEYEAILNAMLQLGIGCVHIKGDSIENLPPRPFRGLRVIFTDLHLSTHVGKDAASHAANVFGSVVSSDSAPAIVVIWSKYKDDSLGAALGSVQPTEAELFKSTLLESFPAFKDRLIFLAMDKPKADRRPLGPAWIKQLQNDISKKLKELSALDALWSWESMVRDSAIAVGEELTSLAMLPGASPESQSMPLLEKIKQTLQLLVREQGGAGCSAKASSRHLSAFLGQSLIDHLEHVDDNGRLSKHGDWLADHALVPKSSPIAPAINGVLLTAEYKANSSPFVPGSVYAVSDEKWQQLFDMSMDQTLPIVYQGSASRLAELRNAKLPQSVLVELSPACDVHQQARRNSLLIGGLVFPCSAAKQLKRAESIEMFPTFHLRWSVGGFAAQDACLVFFSRFKVTLSAKREPRWLKPWFRIRELPTASLRNWHSSHASRVGYVSLR